MSLDQELPEGLVAVPWDALAAETLDALVEEYVTRDGTDYGDSEVPLARKVAQVREQLRRGEVVIVFEEATESVNLLSRRELQERARRLQSP